MEKRITEQESLSIISEMIDRARNNVQKGSGTSMIFWGIAVAFTALLNTLLMFVLEDPNKSFWVWLLIVPFWIISLFIDKKAAKESIVKTPLDRVISSTWGAFGIFNILFLAIIFGLSICLKTHYLFFLINPVILLAAGVAEFVTSNAVRYKPFLTGAIVMWVGALLAALVVVLSDYAVAIQFAILALCLIVGFVVPGYKLNKMAKNV